MINRLRGTTAYLCGPIDKAKDAGVGWRKAITPYLKSWGVRILDPTNKPKHLLPEQSEQIAQRHRLKEKGEYDVLAAFMKQIRKVDLRMVDLSDFVIVYLDLDTPMCGTWDELFQADRQRKPIMIVCPQGISKVPDWLFGTVPYQYMFQNFQSLYEYLCKLDRGDEVESKRWWFLGAEDVEKEPVIQEG